MPAESFEERLRAYLHRASRRTRGPGAVDRVMAADFDGPSRNQSRRLSAAIAIAVAAALAIVAPIAVLALNPRHDNTPAPASRQSASLSPHATTAPSSTVSPAGPQHGPSGPLAYVPKGIFPPVHLDAGFYVLLVAAAVALITAASMVLTIRGGTMKHGERDQTITMAAARER